MKVRLVTLLAVFLSVTLARAEEPAATPKPAATPREYPPDVQAAKLAYAQKVAEADGAKIVLIDYKDESEKAKYQGGESGPVLKEITLTGDDLKLFQDLWVKMLKEEHYRRNSFCHFAIHGISFTKGKEEVFRTTVCWLCNNYYIAMKDGPQSGLQDVGLPSDDVTYELFKAFKQRLPIPKTLLEPMDGYHK